MNLLTSMCVFNFRFFSSNFFIYSSCLCQWLIFRVGSCANLHDFPLNEHVQCRTATFCFLKEVFFHAKYFGHYLSVNLLPSILFAVAEGYTLHCPTCLFLKKTAWSCFLLFHSILILVLNSILGLSRLLNTLLQRHSLIQAGFRDQKVQDWSMSLSSICFTSANASLCHHCQHSRTESHWYSHCVVYRYDIWSVGVVMLELIVGSPHVFQISDRARILMDP